MTDNLRQQYAQTEEDKATGLEHAKWRKMESNAGRWTSPDPYRGSMSKGNPQSLNRYAYTQNDPVNAVDPSGLEMIDAGYYGVEEVIQVNVYASRFTPFYHYDAIGMNIGDNFGAIFDGRPVPEFAEPQIPACPSIPEAPANANLDANIQEAARRYKDSQRLSPYPDAGEDPLSLILAHATWFALQVMPGGQWDYKQQNPSGTQLYTPFGNVHFGAVGRAAGFDEATLLRAAGYVQKIQAMLGTSLPGDGGRVGLINILLGRGGEEPFEDQREDQENIKRGINYHDSKFVRKDCQ